MNDMIEYLKHNQLAWMFLTKAEQKGMHQVNAHCGVENLKFDGEWENSAIPWAALGSGANEIWRIKPDYQPQPEYVDIEIEGGDEKRLVLASPSPLARYWGISIACEDPTFLGFYCQFTECFSRVDVSSVAEKCREGKKVIARFVKEA